VEDRDNIKVEKRQKGEKNRSSQVIRLSFIFVLKEFDRYVFVAPFCCCENVEKFKMKKESNLNN